MLIKVNVDNNKKDTDEETCEENSKENELKDFTAKRNGLSGNINKPTKDGFKNKFRHFLNHVTVEPMLLCFVVPLMVMYLAVQNLNLEKACRVNLNYGQEICDKVLRQDVANLTDRVQTIQKLVAQMQAWKLPLQTTLPAFMIVFVGSWSDRTQRRKTFMMLPSVGEFTTCMGLILCVYYFMEWPLEIAGFIEAVPSALCGGIAIFSMASLSYIADITTHENRTFRLGLATIIAVIGMPIGQSLSGVLVKYLGFYGVFIMSGSMYATSFIYAWTRIDDKGSSSSSSGIVDFFNPKHVGDTFKVLLKPREDYKRAKLFVLIVIEFLVCGPTYGEYGVIYLFVRYKFNFTEMDYSLYGAYSSLVHLTGTLFAIAVLNRRYKVNDYYLGILSAVSKFLGCLMYAYSPTVAWFYVGPVVECFSGFGQVIVKTIASKFVERNEVGRMYSILGIIDALAPTVYNPLYNQIYFHTIGYFPGFFYFLGSLSSLPCLVAYTVMYITRPKIAKENDQNDQNDHVTEGEETERRNQHKEMYAYDNHVSTM